ncbi:MAG TPA: ComEC/Rec2 family competence protein [Clostridia bacterium]
MKRNYLVIILIIAVICLSACSMGGGYDEKKGIDMKRGTSTKLIPEENAESKLDGKLKLFFLDVGQADSILIRTGSSSMLIDAGNNPDGEDVVNYIRNEGVKKLDYVIGTHPHEDHIGGMDDVVNSFDIGKIYMPEASANTRTYADVITAVKNKGLKITRPVPGTNFKLGDAEVTILAPNGKKYDDLNNYSIAVKIVFGKTSFLLTGDAQIESENEMLQKGFDLKADVLKLGHHGSHTSTGPEFLKAVSPEYAVISCGKDNDYGHPHRETMEKLEKANIKVYRTDECGTIICTSDGKSISFNKQPGSYSYPKGHK